MKTNTFGKRLIGNGAPLAMAGLLLVLLASQAFADAFVVKWKTPVDQPTSLAMTADGSYAASVDKNEVVRFYDRTGYLIWKQQVEGATDVLIARNGQSLLVYSRLNPIHQEVHFFRKDGRRLWRHKVRGSVWAGAVSPDGTQAAVTTGQRFIYVYRPDPSYPKYRSWQLDGIGYRVTFSSDSKKVIVGTWQKSLLVCYDIKGKFQWRNKFENDRQYDIAVSEDGRRVLGVYPASEHEPGAEMRFWESGGHQLWKRSLDAFDARAFVSPQSQYVAVSYASFLSKKDTDMIERKVAVYGATGQLLWEKGGLFFGPRLVALSPKGSSVIVTDGEKSLYNIDNRGKILSKLTLSGTVRKTISSADGSNILLYCGNGWMYFLKYTH